MAKEMTEDGWFTPETPYSSRAETMKEVVGSKQGALTAGAQLLFLLPPLPEFLL